MCLVIPILPLARLMKNLKAHSYFRKITLARHTLNHVSCHSDPASCAAYEESQGTWSFTEIETFPAILRSFVRLARGSAQDDENGSVLLR